MLDLCVFKAGVEVAFSQQQMLLPLKQKILLKYLATGSREDGVKP